jgi:hypothetical protein
MKPSLLLALLLALAVSPVVTSQPVWKFVARTTPDLQSEDIAIAIRENTQREIDFWKARYPETTIAFSRSSCGEVTNASCANRVT